MSETTGTEEIGEEDPRDEREDPAIAGSPELVASPEDVDTHGGEPSAAPTNTNDVETDQLRYVYRVVVDGEPDDELLVCDEPVTIEEQVPYRGRKVFVERIEDLNETDRTGDDLGERLEADPDTQIARTLVCRDAEVEESP